MEESNITIAQRIKLEPIVDIAKKIDLNEDDLFLFGRHIAKVDVGLIKRVDKEDGKLILVTAITPTKAGEGKSTVTVGLGQALTKLDKKTIICLREPSLGPVFGIKGGACGGGYSQVLPMEDINLHFTGDLAAVEAANNLLSEAANDVTDLSTFPIFSHLVFPDTFAVSNSPLLLYRTAFTWQFPAVNPVAASVTFCCPWLEGAISIVSL